MSVNKQIGNKTIPCLYEIYMSTHIEAFLHGFNCIKRENEEVLQIPVVFYRTKNYKPGVYSVLSENPWPEPESFVSSETIKSYGFEFQGMGLMKTYKYSLKNKTILGEYLLTAYPDIQEISIDFLHNDTQYTLYCGKCQDSFFKLLLPNLIHNIQRK